MPDVLMACGCRAHGTHPQSHGKYPPNHPSCVVHMCCDFAATPDLTGRRARCEYGGHRETDSSLSLAFFVYQPDQPYDSYYCGCMGWD